MTMTASVQALLAERQQTHGNYEDTAAVTQMIKTVVAHSKNWSHLRATQRQTLEMIAYKMGRILAGNPDEPDHWRDIAGQAWLEYEQLNGSNGQ